MARVRADYVFGTLDVAVDADDTTLSSPQLARLPEIADGDVAAITVEDRQSGAYEIVLVTGHIEGSVTATVLRGQERSTARAWGVGTAWGHNPTAADFAPVEGRYRGEWAAFDEVVVQTIDFADGIIPEVFTTGGISVAVVDYGPIDGTDIDAESRPAKMVRLQNGLGGGSGSWLDVVAGDLGATKVRFWMAYDATGGLYFQVNGATVETVVNGEGWQEFTSPALVPTDVLRWRSIASSATVDSNRGYVARIEAIATPGIVYAVDDLVLHGGALWAAGVAGTTEEPGVGVEWERVPLADDTAITALVEDATPSQLRAAIVALLEAQAADEESAFRGSLDDAYVNREPSVTVVAASGSTEPIAADDEGWYDLTLDQDCTISLTGGIDGRKHRINLILRQDTTGGWSVTWPSSVAWVQGSPSPDLAPDAVSRFEFVTVDAGVSWLGTGYGSAVRSDKKRRTAGTLGISSTAWTPLDGSGGLDLTVAARVGDTLAISVNGMWNNQAVHGRMDAMVRVAGADLRRVSGSDFGVPSWTGLSGEFGPIGPAYFHTVAADEVSAGVITLRPVFRCDEAIMKTLLAQALPAGTPLDVAVVNLG